MSNNQVIKVNIFKNILLDSAIIPLNNLSKAIFIKILIDIKLKNTRKKKLKTKY